MPDPVDFLRCIAADPANDLPRLAYADWLDERGDAEYADFIRTQIHLASLPPWHPKQVRARNQDRTRLLEGREFVSRYRAADEPSSDLGTMGPLPSDGRSFEYRLLSDSQYLSWHDEQPFERGIPSRLTVRQLSGLFEIGDALFDQFPVRELFLGSATLDDWRRLARSPWLSRIRRIQLSMTTGLIEPVRCLIESPHATALDELSFDGFTTPAAGTILETLANSGLGRRLTGLHIRLGGSDTIDEIIDALGQGFPNLTALTLDNVGLTADHMPRLMGMPFMIPMKNLSLANNPIGLQGLITLVESLNTGSLENLKLSGTDVSFDDFDCSNHEAALSPPGLHTFYGPPGLNQEYHFRLLLPMLRSARCLHLKAITPYALQLMDHLGIWSGLTELNLDQATLAFDGIEQLMSLPVPEDLAAITVSEFANRGVSESTQPFHLRFGERFNGIHFDDCIFPATTTRRRQTHARSSGNEESPSVP